jgi:hypothetical protein
MADEANGRTLRERVVVGVIAIFVALAVYTAYGFAVGFKTLVEMPQKVRHSFSTRG